MPLDCAAIRQGGLFDRLPTTTATANGHLRHEEPTNTTNGNDARQPDPPYPPFQRGETDGGNAARCDYEMRARQWIERNPRLWEALRDRFRYRLEVGRPFSVMRLCQDLRWDVPGPKADGEDFKLNHNYIPWLTRLLLDEFPEAGGLVRIKRGKHVDG